MTDPSAGRFTESAMTQAMHAVAERLGASPEGARLLRLTNNAVFALPQAGIVIRISRSHGLTERVHKVVRLADWFAVTDAPTIRLVSSVEQPIRAGDLLATVWHHTPPSPEPLTVADLGLVLRRFHQLTPPPWLPLWDPAHDGYLRMADAEGLSDRDRALLAGWCESLQPRIAALQGRHEPRLIHGDAHTGNLLRDSDGRVLLCDFDSTCLGPWQFDLVAMAVGERRFGCAGVYRALADAYGYDVTADPDWPLLREAREFKMVIGALPYLRSTPGAAREFRLRLRSVLDGEVNARWTPFAELTT